RSCNRNRKALGCSPSTVAGTVGRADKPAIVAIREGGIRGGIDGAGSAGLAPSLNRRVPDVMLFHTGRGFDIQLVLCGSRYGCPTVGWRGVADGSAWRTECCCSRYRHGNSEGSRSRQGAVASAVIGSDVPSVTAIHEGRIWTGRDGTTYF